MPIRHGGSCAISGSSCSRDTLGLTSTGFAVIIYAMHRKDVLGEIDSYGDNAHGLPLSWF